MFSYKVGKPRLLENPAYLLFFFLSYLTKFGLKPIELFVESFCPISGQIRPEDDFLDPCKR